MDLWGAPRCDRWRRSPLTKLTIAIAHHLSTLRNTDCIYVMEQGQLVEGGSHEELLERVEPYASLWRVQMG
jgi:ATP-binding cassette subfamily B protein